MSAVLLSAFGGRTVGYGHVRRSLELARVLESRGHRAVVHLPEGVSELVEGWGWVSAGLHITETPLEHAIAEEAADALVIDRPRSMGRPPLSVANPQPVIALDYYDFDDPAVDTTISLLMPSTISAQDPSALVGLRYAIVRQDVRAAGCDAQPPAEKVERILLTMGSSDPAGRTPLVLDALAATVFTGEVTVILGPGVPPVDMPPGAHFNMSTHVNPADFPALLASHDLVICGGGTTLLEACHLGRPAVVVPQTEDEEWFATEVSAEGACIVSAPVTGLLAVRLEWLLRDFGVRAEMSETGRALIDGGGAERIAEVVESAITSARADAPGFMRERLARVRRQVLRSDRLVLRVLGESDVTPDYLGWLADAAVTRYLSIAGTAQNHATVTEYVRTMATRDDALLLGVFLAGSGQHVGNVTLNPLDIAGRRASIGIMIGDRSQWGRGVATEALKVVTDFAFDVLGLEVVFAGVAETNEKSRMLFERCGFSLEECRESAALVDGARCDGLTYALRRHNG